MLDLRAARTAAQPRPAAAGLPGASRRARGARAAGAHRSRDQQGHRAASAGALAVPGRPAGGSARAPSCSPTWSMPRARIRHAGCGRRAGRVCGDLFRGDGPSGRTRSRRPGCTRSQNPIRARSRVVAALPGRGDHGRRAARSRAMAWRACRCRSRRPASMPRPISPRHCA